jgi:RNA polymerase sigma-70 factor (ECF subfamily)
MSFTGANEPEPASARFEAVALPFMDALYNQALHLTRRPEDAGDLVQETFLRAYRTFGNFAEGTNARAWLFTILYSVFINRYRKEQREPDRVSMDEMEETFQQTLADPDWEANFIALVDAQLDWSGPEVRSALGSLPENFRAAVLLVDVEGLTYEEAAAVVECPVGTLRSRLFRARRLLFVALRDYAQRAGFLKGTQV